MSKQCRSRIHILTITILLSIISASCANNYQGRSTAELTQPGITALHTLEVVKVLDVIRDLAIDSEKAKFISVNTTRRIILFHQAALQTIQSLPNGWREIILTSLKSLDSVLTVEEKKIIEPYILAAMSLIEKVIQ